MAFPAAEVEKLLAACHRRCCICHRFCGVKMELDHIIPRADDGPDEICNALPVCFECHAEIHSYNENHPRGRKFRPGELRQHKDEWLRICRETPRELVSAPRNSGVGPLQAMIDELEYNIIAAQHLEPEIKGDAFKKAAGLFRDDQFILAISQGAISILNEDLRTSILNAYVLVGELKQLTAASVYQTGRDHAHGYTNSQASARLREVSEVLGKAHGLLLSFLGHKAD